MDWFFYFGRCSAVHWNGADDGGAAAFFGFKTDRSIVCFDDTFNDIQTKSGSYSPVSSPAELGEFGKEQMLFVFGNTGTGVRNRDDDAADGRFGGDLDGAT